MLQEKIRTLAASFHPELVDIRRHLHQYPELSFEEKQTAAYIAQKLHHWGISFQTDVAGHGIVALLEGVDPGSGIRALRADMDALPIQEANAVTYRSKVPGVMHACGHDVHTTSLLGTARILHQLRDHWKGSVKLLFQPGEERLPGGASQMIREGVLQNPAPAYMLGQHVEPFMETGMVGFCSGPYMASADEIYITLRGKGGHAAMPHQTVDTILMAAQLINHLQQVVSRNTHPATPAVLSFGKIWSEGGATNIIPDEVKLMGTFRTMDENWRFEAHELIRRICFHLTASMGGTADVDIQVGYPPLYNDPEITRQCKQLAVAYLGQDKVLDLPIRMTSEDFAFYSQQIPASFYRLGTGSPAGRSPSAVHTPTFDIDEESLRIGSGLMAWLAVGR